jgi:hypothetical protein
MLKIGKTCRIIRVMFKCCCIFISVKPPSEVAILTLKLGVILLSTLS